MELASVQNLLRPIIYIVLSGARHGFLQGAGAVKGTAR